MRSACASVRATTMCRVMPIFGSAAASRAERRPFLPVAVGDGARARRRPERNHVDRARRRPGDRLGIGRAVPDRRMRALQRLGLHDIVFVIVELAFEIRARRSRRRASAPRRPRDTSPAHPPDRRHIADARSARRRGRRRPSAARRSCGRACRFLHRAAADDRAAAHRPAAPAGCAWCAAMAAARNTLGLAAMPSGVEWCSAR